MRTLGLRGSEFLLFQVLTMNSTLQSLSQKSEIFVSSLYTREPGCSRTSAVFDSSLKFLYKNRPVCIANRAVPYLFYFPGLKESFRLTERLNTRCSGLESLLSGQK